MANLPNSQAPGGKKFRKIKIDNLFRGIDPGFFLTTGITSPERRFGELDPEIFSKNLYMATAVSENESGPQRFPGLERDGMDVRDSLAPKSLPPKPAWW